jgi:hypothetical protein
VLHTSKEIRSEVLRIFKRQRQRRVAIVAYVGKSALAYLPKPKGLQLYCWPQAGGTSATAVEALQKRKADVFFADRVHMKVYWTERDGAVIGSANLSDNALGAGNLRECAVALASGSVDIDRLIAIVGGKLADDRALDRLRKAEAAWQRSHAMEGKVAIPSFTEWYDGKGGAAWKWDYYNSFGGVISRRARRAVQEIDPAYEPEAFAYCNRGSFNEEDWILRCRLTRNGSLLAPEWLYIELVVLVEKNDRAYEKDYPYQAVQVRALRHCPAPPFAISSDFKRALREVSRRTGFERMSRQVGAKPPTSAFLKSLRDHL